MKRILILVFTFLVTILMLSPVNAGNLENYYDGIEKEIFGHSFDEEYWSTEITNVTEAGASVKFSISYVNQSNVQVFLVALHSVINADNGTGTLPYQLFGMHFVTDAGEEVFISALLAFLLVYNDTNGNGIPDPASEKMFHVIPFGADKSLNGSYAPKVSSITVNKISDTHYKFGMRYENLYALVTENYLATAFWKTGWIAKFSEFEVIYDVNFNEETGEVTAETFYTIGEVTELWAFILGIPLKADPDDIPDNFGLAAAHYVTVFTSKYDVKGSDSGKTINTDITEPVKENITIDVKSKRAFEIGFRGDYTLLDSNNQVAKNESPAINILLQARPEDLGLVLWQLGFSAQVFSFMAYGLSSHVRSIYQSPNDLKLKSLNVFNRYGFRASALWYVVCFPEWNGYKVVHDPVYTAYASDIIPNEPKKEKDNGGLCSSSFGIFGVMVAVPAFVVVRKRRSGEV